VLYALKTVLLPPIEEPRTEGGLDLRVAYAVPTRTIGAASPRPHRWREAFANKNPKDLKLTTFADEIDRALDNESVVGMLAWRSWHMGMLGHGLGSEAATRTSWH
jgi:hypothetical protein